MSIVPWVKRSRGIVSRRGEQLGTQRTGDEHCWQVVLRFLSLNFAGTCAPTTFLRACARKLQSSFLRTRATHGETQVARLGRRRERRATPDTETHGATRAVLSVLDGAAPTGDVTAVGFEPTPLRTGT